MATLATAAGRSRPTDAMIGETLRPTRTTFGWAIGAQMLSSATNFGAGIVAARFLGTRGFGPFGLAFATYTIVMGASRSLVSEPLLVRYANGNVKRIELGVALSTGSALSFGFICAAASFALASIAPASLKSMLVALGIVLPGLLLQDAWRFAFIARNRPEQTFANDLVWGVLLVPALVATALLAPRSAAAFILAWGGTGSIAALFGMWQATALPHPSGLPRWLREQRDLAPRYLAEFGARNGAQAGLVYTTAALSGIVEAGALRAGQILLGPPNVVNMGASAPAIPIVIDKLGHGDFEGAYRFTKWLSWGIAVPALLWGALVWAIPDDAGRWLMGEMWEPAQAVAVPLSIGLAAAGWQTGPTVGLRALADARRSLQARILTSIAAIGGGAVGAAIGGAVGAATGFSTGLWVAAAAWWHLYRTSLCQKTDDGRALRPRRKEEP